MTPSMTKSATPYKPLAHCGPALKTQEVTLLVYFEPSFNNVKAGL